MQMTIIYTNQGKILTSQNLMLRIQASKCLFLLCLFIYLFILTAIWHLMLHADNFHNILSRQLHVQSQQ